MTLPKKPAGSLTRWIFHRQPGPLPSDSLSAISHNGQTQRPWTVQAKWNRLDERQHQQNFKQ